MDGISMCINLFPIFPGIQVPQDEQTSEAADALSSSSSTHNLPKLTVPGVPATVGGGISDEERSIWEGEKQNLYQQLDDKVREIYITLMRLFESICKYMYFCLFYTT